MNRKTVFILGAGSSKEVSFPDGRLLGELIVRDLNIRFKAFGATVDSGSQRIANAIRAHAPTQVNMYQRAALEVSAGLPFANSIDTFLDSHKDNEHMQLCGKIAIVNCILEAERASQLYVDPARNRNDPIQFRGIERTWFGSLFRSLSEGVSRDNPDALFDKLSIINFNYDRCVEHFLYHAIQLRFSVSEDVAARCLRMLQIIHPYGSIGALPFEKNEGAVEFGNTEISPASLAVLARNIRTFTERVESDDLRQQILNELNNAECVVFMGFAYHRQNMELLSLEKAHDPLERRPVSVLGTAYEMSKPNIDAIERSIFDAFHPAANLISVNLENATCFGLLDNYRKILFN